MYMNVHMLFHVHVCTCMYFVYTCRLRRSNPDLPLPPFLAYWEFWAIRGCGRGGGEVSFCKLNNFTRMDVFHDVRIGTGIILRLY